MDRPLSKAAPEMAQDAAARDARPLLVGLLLTAMLAVMSVAYGFQYRSDSANPLGYFLSYSALYFLCLALVFFIGLCPPLPGTGRERWSVPAAGLAMTTAMIALCVYFHAGELPLPALPAAAGLVVAVGAVAATLGVGRAVRLALLLGLAVQIALALTNPLDVAAANMLPVIEAGCGKLLAGENPYLAAYPGITSVPLMYLPGLLLPYCAPVAAGLDLRVLNVILLLVLVGYAAWALDFRRHPERLSLGLLPLLFSPLAGQMMVHGHVWLYWLLVLVFVHALARRRFLAAALLLGLMLATRQMSLFLVIPAAAYMATRLKLPALLGYGAISIAIYFAIMAPVMLTTPDWIELFYLSATRVGEESHLVYGNPMNQVSLSGLLTQLGLAGVLPFLQVAVLLLAAAAFWAWRRWLAFHQALILLGVAYVLVIGLNVFLHRYFYIPGLLLIALAIAYATPGSLSPADETRKRE